MAHAHRHAGDLIASTHIFGEGGLGVLGSEVPSTGLDGPALIYNDLSLPSEANNEFRALITSIPAGGAFFAYEDSSFSATGYADGTYSGSYQGFKDGTAYGTASFTFTVGATPATVLTPGTAALTLAGFAPRLTLAHTLPAVQATFTAAFPDARLLRGRKVVAAQASFAATFNAALLLRSRPITAAPASFAATFPAARLLRGYRLVAALAAYTSNFPANRLLHGYKVVATTASYTTTFIAANLLKGVAPKVLNADAAAFAATFNATALKLSRRLTAAPAAFTWTGNAAQLVKGRAVIAAPAAFTATFNAATFARARRMTAATGAFATTFNAASIFRGTVHGEPSLARRFVITADHHGKSKSDYFDIRPRPQIPKDPNATLDYTWDWALWLADGVDTIVDYTITPTNGLAIVASQESAGLVTAWVSGGTVGKVARLTCRITASSGRIDDRTLYLQIRDR